MNRLIDSLAKRQNISKSAAKQLLFTIPGLIAALLDNGKTVKWRGLGTFRARYIPIKTVKSNITKKLEITKEKMKLTFTPSKVLESSIKLKKPRGQR